MATDETREMDDVARHLSRTRSQLDQTLDELGRRLDPEHLRSEATTYVRDRVARLRERAAAFTSEHAGASLGAVAALTALATLARRRRSRAFDAERAVRTLLQANGLEPGRPDFAPSRGRGSAGRRVAMLAALAGLAWTVISAGRDTASSRRTSHGRSRPPVLP